MSIVNVLQTLGFTTSETETLANEVYAHAGQANLTFATGYIQSVIQKYRKDETIKLKESEIKRLVTLAALASNFAANAAALAEVGIPTEVLSVVVSDVLQWVADKQKQTPPPTMN